MLLVTVYLILVNFENIFCSQHNLSSRPSIGRHDAVVLSRELVFDIDLTDYDEVRTCCQEAKVCAKCWKLMVIACEIIDKSLKGTFLVTFLLNFSFVKVLGSDC